MTRNTLTAQATLMLHNIVQLEISRISEEVKSSLVGLCAFLGWVKNVKLASGLRTRNLIVNS